MKFLTAAISLLVFLLASSAFAITPEDLTQYPQPGASEIWRARFGASVPLEPVDAAAQAQVKTGNRRAMQAMHAHTPLFTGEPDSDFVSAMIPHHQAAVDMCDIELHYGRDPKMRAMAEYIRKEQLVEMALMQRWLDTEGYRWRNPGFPTTRLYPEVMEAMHRAMHPSLATGQPDHDFAALMIPHHQGAVDMAGVQFGYGRSRFLTKLAWNIFQAQQVEIGVLQDWLDAHANR